ncbi:MAG: MerR family transcriptional regulator [Caulobacteraceae bacterium]
MAKGPEAFRTISEAAAELGVAQHVLRFWETKFPFVRPMTRAGGRRFYRPRDLTVLAAVRRLLHSEGYTIKGVQKLHREGGLKSLTGEEAVAAPPAVEAGAGSRPALAADAGAREKLEACLVALEAAKARLDDRLGLR